MNMETKLCIVYGTRPVQQSWYDIQGWMFTLVNYTKEFFDSLFLLQRRASLSWSQWNIELYCERQRIIWNYDAIGNEPITQLTRIGGYLQATDYSVEVLTDFWSRATEYLDFSQNHQVVNYKCKYEKWSEWRNMTYTNLCIFFLSLKLNMRLPCVWHSSRIGYFRRENVHLNLKKKCRPFGECIRCTLRSIVIEWILMKKHSSLRSSRVVPSNEFANSINDVEIIQ